MVLEGQSPPSFHCLFYGNLRVILSFYQSWARIPAGPSRDACPRSFISSSSSAFPRAFSKLFFPVPRFAFLHYAFQILKRIPVSLA